MKTLKLVDWKRGLLTISLINNMQLYAGLSLREAKAGVDGLLRWDHVVLSFKDEALREKFRRSAEECGAIVVADQKSEGR